MNAADVLKYGNLTVLGTLDGLSAAQWETPNVCGWWSTKNIIAHLSSFEWLLVDVLNGYLDGGATPCLGEFFNVGPERFNDIEVDMRKDKTPSEILDEYARAHAQTMTLSARIPTDECHQTGRLQWYGAEYDLEDFITYQYYGHKREHCAQINVYRDTLKTAHE